MDIETATAIFVEGFAHLQRFVGPVTEIKAHGMRGLAFAAGRRAGRFRVELFAVDADPGAALAAAGELAGDEPHMIDLIGHGQEARLPAYLAAGYAHWGEETIMARDLTAVAAESDPRVRTVATPEEAAAIVAAQKAAGLRAHPVTAAHVADPRTLDRWIAVDGEVAAFGRVALVGGADAYLADVVTLPDFRRRGLAAALVGGLLADARAAGATRCVLAATPMAHGLYAGLGFVAVTPMLGVNTP